MFDDYPAILLPEEVSEILRIGMNEMYKILNNGQLSAYRVGRSWRIPKENLINYIQSQTF
ncbi:dNA binding domain excisionase family [Clostridium sp. CAG:277]|jgi:excisionase family DNA binding protein|nr:dNA binding domain excisionase family [Clostridium sp. CAG:277]